MGKENAAGNKGSAQANSVKLERATASNFMTIKPSPYCDPEQREKLIADKQDLIVKLRGYETKFAKTKKARSDLKAKITPKSSAKLKEAVQKKLDQLDKFDITFEKEKKAFIQTYIQKFNIAVDWAEKDIEHQALKAQHEVTLARLDSQRAEQRAAHANLDAARAKQRAAHANLDDARAKQRTAHADVDAAKAQFANTQAQAQQLKAQYDNLVAKRDGYIQEVIGLKQEILEIEEDRRKQHAEIDRRAEAILNGFVDDTVARFSVPKSVSVS